MKIDQELSINDLAIMMAKGFEQTATKDDIRRIEGVLTEHTKVLDEHSESLGRLEENDILNLQVRVSTLEKNMRKHHGRNR